VILVDTSVWVEVLRDRTGRRSAALEAALDGEETVLSRFQQLELLQGALDEREWNLLREYLEVQEYLECSPTSWADAARIFFDLRRRGKTVRSPIDCCIAQLAIEHDVLLLHRDRDFETIAEVTPLSQKRLAW
jgi:predicted nucleic acid-binding protein